MELFGICFHEKVHDSQGAIYCIKCRKFFGWMPGGIIRTKHEINGVSYDTVEAWGYLLNGSDWKEKREMKIKFDNGLYV